MASGSSAGSLGLSERSALLWPEMLSGLSLEVSDSGSFSLEVTPPASSSSEAICKKTSGRGGSRCRRGGRNVRFTDVEDARTAIAPRILRRDRTSL